MFGFDNQFGTQRAFVDIQIDRKSKTGEKQKNKGKAMFILKELRTEHGLKRSELARETGINANTLAKNHILLVFIHINGYNTIII